MKGCEERFVGIRINISSQEIIRTRTRIDVVSVHLMPAGRTVPGGSANSEWIVKVKRKKR